MNITEFLLVEGVLQFRSVLLSGFGDFTHFYNLIVCELNYLVFIY